MSEIVLKKDKYLIRIFTINKVDGFFYKIYRNLESTHTIAF
jgi:hypothetical protein